MAAMNGRESCLNRTRPDRGKDMATNYNLNSSGKRKRLDCGKHKAPGCKDSADLWATLPECLVEEILAKLPFSSLVRFCSVCKRWRDLILGSGIAPRCISDRGHLFLFSNDKLITFNSSRGTWETVPLQFLQMQFKLLDVVSSAGGLLCFSTMVVGEYIVCNPLTKSFKRLQMPCSAAWSTSDQPCMPTGPASSDVNFCYSRYSRYSKLVYLVRGFLVGMVLHSDAGHFKLIVAGLFPSSRGTTLVYDSHADIWKKVANIPEDVPRNISCWRRPWTMHDPRIVCGGNFYAYFRDADSIANRLFKYDVEQQEWVSSLLPHLTFVQGEVPQVFIGDVLPGDFDLQEDDNIIEYDGKILLVTSRWRRDGTRKSAVFELELQETGCHFWLRKDKLPFSRVCEALSEKEDSTCLGQGNVMLVIRGLGPRELPGSYLNWRTSSLNEDIASRYLMKISVIEFFHNVATKSYSEVLSKWSERYKGDVMFPDFQIFRPSLLGFK